MVKIKEENAMEHDILCIFTHTGRTYTFRNVKVIHHNESVLAFNYTAMSDGKVKTATFPKANIAGWSVTPKE